MDYLPAYLQGLSLSAGLIMAIGAQNAHVIRMGLSRQHIALTVATCTLIDMLLIAAGVAGMGLLIQSSPLLLQGARWGGAGFLFWYGVRSWRAVWQSHSLAAGADRPLTARAALLTVLAMSLLNPHVYLDTVVLIGAIGGGFPAPARPAFALGAMSASALWFSALALGARQLAPLFQRPLAWKCIDALTGSTMLVLAWQVDKGW
ncbi:LysE/ArgO family amino acid transporter [Massilia sp. TS11]|uniref:LysE/ArgO family amino acid transporter n=1 Tax=Massilia sp. TS11 TaxID=2908003 RepID=UPI001EDC2C95|nr:LysE/ArgO family amino acid transporter [Massilia sp. TS11]MCG2584216.1 LysE/ArgO family amino acid transporter [Massilia sp. TS11]